MPGPQSHPVAKTADGRIVKGKSALKHAGLRSGERMTQDDWHRTAVGR